MSFLPANPSRLGFWLLVLGCCEVGFQCEMGFFFFLNLEGEGKMGHLGRSGGGKKQSRSGSRFI